MKCDNCGCNESYIKDYKHNFIIKGKKIEFISKRRFCSKCNNLIYDAKLDNVVSNKAIMLYNKNYGISKERIIELRNKYNLSQELFSKILGCAKKTLISYEKGNSIPNDNYVIIINSLIYNPSIILTIVNSNKQKFTDKEINKIKNNLSDLSEKFLFDNELSEYNGYTNFNLEKVLNVISFFSKGKVLKTKLLKEMFYSDFLFYKNYGKSITGLEYNKFMYGPVPNEFDNILNECVKLGIINYTIQYKNDYENHNIVSKKFDNRVFSKEEINLLKSVKNYFKYFSSSDIVSKSHSEKAFIDTEYFKKISYDYSFDMEELK